MAFARLLGEAKAEVAPQQRLTKRCEQICMLHTPLDKPTYLMQAVKVASRVEYSGH